MRKKIFIISWFLIIGISNGCNNRSGKEFNDIESLLYDLSKNKGITLNKFPPKLVKAFLKYDNSNNEGLEELLSLSKLFIVIHITKTDNISAYKLVRDDLEHHIEKIGLEQIKSIIIERIYLKEYYFQLSDNLKELVLEIDEPGLYSVYCLKGEFTREEILEVSENVSPVNFLRLNRMLYKPDK